MGEAWDRAGVVWAAEGLWTPSMAAVSSKPSRSGSAKQRTSAMEVWMPFLFKQQSGGLAPRRDGCGSRAPGANGSY